MAKLRRDHTQLHRGLYFLSFATSICFILIHWEKGRAATQPGSASNGPVLGPPLGKYLILTHGCLLYGQPAAEMHKMALRELRLLFPVALPEHRAHPDLLLPALVPLSGQAASEGTSPAALQVTHLGGMSPGFVPKSSFPIHKKDCLRFHAFNATFRQAAAAWQ